MRGIERLVATLLLVGAVAGAAVFAHGLGTNDEAAPLTFAAAPPAAAPATTTVRIALPPAPVQRLVRPDTSSGTGRAPSVPVLPARPAAPRIAVTSVTGSRRLVVHVAAPKPSAPPKPKPAEPVRTPAAPDVPPTQLAHVKVPLTPTDPDRILATTPVPLTPTAPAPTTADGGRATGDSGPWSAHGNGHGRGHAD